jgi:hypothetical protein
MALITILSIMCMLTFTSSTHLTNATGVISWGNTCGWRTMTFHISGSSFTYRIISSNNMTNSIINAINNGASSWSSVMSITRVTSGGTGTVQFENANNFGLDWIAYAEPLKESGQHITSYKIALNPNYAGSITSKVMAHEFGHIIGLDDLGKPSHGDTPLARNHNMGNIMWYTDGTLASAPTSRDRAGARVITGAHTSHTFSARYFPQKATLSNGVVRNRHRRACNSCYGWQFGSAIETCSNYIGGQCSTCHTYRNGNVTRSGRISIDDTLEILKYLSTQTDHNITTSERYYLADANGDGFITIDDVLEINKYLAGLPSKVG